MMARGSRGLVWAIAGGIVLLAGVAALILAAVFSQSLPDPSDPSSPPSHAVDLPSSSSTSSVDAVDPSVSKKGWVPEPITTDRAKYVQAALAAASTFDTTKSSREDWLAYLGTWFTPDTRYRTESDRAADMQAAKLELRQGVVLPESDWDSLAAENGRVAGKVSGPVSFSPVPEDSSGEMWIATALVTLTYTRSDGSGGESSYDEQAKVSVQVLCGAGSVPVPSTAQRAGDCKVVRYFSSPVES